MRYVFLFCWHDSCWKEIMNRHEWEKLLSTLFYIFLTVYHFFTSNKKRKIYQETTFVSDFFAMLVEESFSFFWKSFFNAKTDKKLCFKTRNHTRFQKKFSPFPMRFISDGGKNGKVLQNVNFIILSTNT